jgi:hypothetical protein
VRAFDPWRFPPGEPIRIVCGEVPEDWLARMPYTDPRDPDYIALYRFADLDSLLEIYGYLSRVNPDSPVVAKLPRDMSASDYQQHVVLLGGVDWNEATRYMLEQIQRVDPTRGMPVRQQGFDENEPETEGFYVEDASFRAHLAMHGDPPRLIEDVAHFFRGPNPANAARTVTFCNGMYGRGVLGAVLALTGASYRERNARFIQNRFGDGAETYSVLSRVRILGGEVVAPDWTVSGNVLHEWPEPTAEESGTRG